MPPPSPIVNVMTGAARKAARGLIRDFGEVEQLQVSLKGPADFVSSADIKAERVLQRELGRARPNFGFLLEESGDIEGGDKANRWVVDPLDGTLNFLHGLPHFAISIAHERMGEVVAGLIYDPLRDEMFIAEKGQGAFVNDRRLRVSARRKLSEAVLATGIPCLGRGRHPAYVAAGRFEGFWEIGLKRWDIAAGILLVREAGGVVSEVDGGGNVLESGNVLATNDFLNQPIAGLLRGGAERRR